MNRQFLELKICVTEVNLIC